jgi:FkbM family methyltransferase
MNIKKTFRRLAAIFVRACFLLVKNPGLLAKKTVAKALLLLPAPRRQVVRVREGVRFSFDCRYDRAVEWMYRGAYEIEVVDAMRGILKRGDTFIDVGANIGYDSFIAASIIGPTGHVHAFEPVDEYYERLAEFARMNPGFDIVTNNCALGDRVGTAEISVSDYHNIGWNTMVPGLMARRMLLETRETTIERLDDYIQQRRLGPVSLIKIDTEGYELPILEGLGRYLEGSGDRPSIICEVNPEAYPRLGRTLGELSAYLGRYSYRAFDLIARGREVNITKITVNTNILLVSETSAHGRREG